MTKLLLLFTTAIIIIGCKPSLTGLYKSKTRFSPTRLVLYQNNAFHYLNASDLGCSQGFGHYEMKDSNLVLSFMDTIRNIGVKDILHVALEDSISIFYQNSEEKFNLNAEVLITEKATGLPVDLSKKSITLMGNESIALYKGSVNPSHQVLLVLRVSSHESVVTYIEEPGKYFISHKFEKGCEGLKNKSIWTVPIIDIAKDSLVLFHNNMNEVFFRQQYE